ncbi:MAG: S9 family peptidase [Ignavibacteriae bacterium]|nr:MAG: S9 family peptidase [Ignavibacteriota bacterium]
MNTNMTPPKAKKIPVEIINHDDVRIDNYQWLKDKNNPEVIEYLKAENNYTEAYMEDVKPLQEKIYNETISRIKEDDDSVPYKRGDYMYYNKRETGKDYPIYFRKKIGDVNEEMILDVNKIAEELPYCSVFIEPSPDNKILVYAVDSKGDHSHKVYFKNLQTGNMIEDTLKSVGGLEWANDSEHLYYAVYERGNMGKQFFRHCIGEKQENDKLLLEEKDDKFWMYISKSNSKKYTLLNSGCFTETEAYYIDADNPESEPVIIEKRTKDIKFSIEHNGDYFYILTNYNAPNYRVMTAPVNNPGIKNWKEFIPEKESVKIEDMWMFKEYLVLIERDYGLNKIKVINLKNNESHYVEFPEPVYTIYPSDNYEFDTKYIRYTYMSFTTPLSYYDHDMEKPANFLLKQTEVPGGYNKDEYITERRLAPSHDGKLIPVSLVYKKGIEMNGKNPLFLHSYGSYGISSEIWFSAARLSLLDRGFIYAVAHIRGGGELGENWYTDGKLMNKKNTFKDFISCSEFLIKEGYTYKGGIAAIGASAGGTLMGAVTNMRPDLFKCIIAKVPAVDILNNLFDPGVENSAVHFGELGNPNIKEEYDYLKSYSPYENIEAKDYPQILLTTGLNDANVPFWEPAKYTAKMRELNPDGNVVLLLTEFDSAHFGPSGRYNMYKQMAYEFAFILKSFGVMSS